MARSKPTWWRRAGAAMGKRLMDLTAFSGASMPTSYAGAQVNRLTMDWVTSPLSADRELQADLRRLRARARELYRNSALAKQFGRLFRINVVGPKGIMCQPRQIRGDRPHDTNNDAVLKAWKAWGKRENCSANGRLSWRAVERMVALNWAIDGEAIIEMLPGFDNDFGFALQMWDADQLDLELNRAAGPDGAEVRMGVEQNQWGKPIAYHLWRRHPTDTQPGERIRIPAERIIHLYDADRVGQSRGVPMLHAAMMEARMLQGYREAELVAARTAAAKMGFIQQDADAFPVPTDGPASSITPQMDASPGTIETLAPGQTFAQWDPQHPTSAFGEFCKAVMRHYAAAVGVSYMSLTGDLSDTSYSSGRIGLLAERDVWMDLQETMIETVHQRVFEAWVPQAILTGQLVGGNAKAAETVVWRPRRWPWVDPQKDLDAAAIAIEQGLTSRTRVCAESGEDVFEIMDELAEEKEYAEEKGLELGEPKPEPPPGFGGDDPEGGDKPAAKDDQKAPAPRSLSVAR